MIWIFIVVSSTTTILKSNTRIFYLSQLIKTLPHSGSSLIQTSIPLQKPQYPHCVVEKFHLVQTISKLPENNHNPFERNCTKWLQWQGVTRKNSAKKSKNLSKNSEMNTFILKNSMKIKSPNFIHNSWIKNTTSIPFLNSSKAIIILPGTKPFIPDSETCVLKIIKNSFFFYLISHSWLLWFFFWKFFIPLGT